MYLRVTERRNRDGSSIAYYALAENVWNPTAKRSEVRVVHSFGRADRIDKAALQRLVASINRVIDTDAADALPLRGKTALPEIEIDAVFELGIVLAARSLWEVLDIGEAIRTRLARAGLAASHEIALFAMATQRLDDPDSKLGCAARWLPDVVWLPEAGQLMVDQLYRALDFLAVWSEEIERDVFLHSADLLRLDVDLIFYDTTTAYFEIDEPDAHAELWGGRLFAPLRQRGHSKDDHDGNPQVVIALAVTRDGMPVRSWVLPGNTADVTTVARIKQDLHAWRLGRCLFVGGLPPWEWRDEIGALRSESSDPFHDHPCLGGRSVTDTGMQPLPVIEHLDVIEHGRFGCLAGGEPAVINMFDLERGKHALHGCIVQAVATAAHGLKEAVTLQHGPIRLRSILHAAIAVMDQTRCWGMTLQSHDQGVDA